MTDKTEPTALVIAEELNEWARDYAPTELATALATCAAVLLKNQNARIAELEALQVAPAAPKAVPVLYVSPAQLEKHLDLEGAENAKAGRYLPARKTPAGKFTQPLYALAATLTQVSAGITIDFKQATELLAMFGGEPAEVTLIEGPGHNGEGLYAYYSDLPEEGAEFLGKPDNEALPAAQAQEHTTQLAGQGLEKCVCTFAQRVVGDGCRHCNPQEYIDRLHKCLDEYREEAAAPAQAQAQGARHVIALCESVEAKNKGTTEFERGMRTAAKRIRKEMDISAQARDAARQAIRDYHYALDDRQHGGAAAGKAVDAIQNAFDMHWVPGKEFAARAAQGGAAC